MRQFRPVRRLYPARGSFADCRGVSAIEFGLIAPVIVILVIGIIDFGMALWNDMQVANAAQAGAAYASVHGWSTTAGNVESAVSSATKLSLSSNSASIISCSSSSVGPCSPNNGGSGNYWQVSAAASYSTILPWPGLSQPMNLAFTAYAKLYP